MSSDLAFTWDGGCYEVERFSPAELARFQEEEEERKEKWRIAKEEEERYIAEMLAKDPNFEPPAVMWPYNPPDKLAISLEDRWLPGSTIKIKFLNGSDIVHQRVIKYARIWTEHAGLSFEFVPKTKNADAKISFGGMPSSWCLIGRACTGKSQNTETMHFGCLTENSSDEEYSRTVLHEFGHLLGFVHEHQQPNASSIQWNKEQVYRDCAKEMGWGVSKVDEQILNPKDPKKFKIDASPFDQLSIMMYPVRKSWVVGATMDIPFNTRLSLVDIQMAKTWYPRFIITKISP
ncbi:hypothetical protein H072_1755 [Dactylellina haptotyla CBS 200.50]|uniref:Peptidase M12A domain-containing protein n=1 Tax=Dactylellina haptotyla (strain CBS 200.50) TaxID=1284197 RepID=S8ATC7_DACHA|nr:hypothetical protein H072_1755 [Dactylellina haptotyla CBS 200.50]